jgi:tRNA A-37 threonylcarbamoyl transferase component Bud32
VLKRDAHSLAGLLELSGKPVFIKLYLAKGPVQRLGFRLGRGRGLRSFDRARALLGAGVRVPEPRACVGCPGALLLQTEAVPGAVDLKARWRASPPEAVRRELMEAAGEALGALHRAGFAHGDCKWSNLLCAAEGVYLADLEAVRRAPLAASHLWRDLARFTLNAEDLAVSSGDYRAFIDSYVSASGIPREMLLPRTLPILLRLRGRHQRRYGERGAPLLEQALSGGR